MGGWIGGWIGHKGWIGVRDRTSGWIRVKETHCGWIGARSVEARSVVVGSQLGLWLLEWTSVCGRRVAAFGSCSPFLSLSLSQSGIHLK